METEKKSESPKWNITTKVIVFLIFLIGIVALIFQFSSLFKTVIIAFIIAVLYHPIVDWICRKTRISWGWSVVIVYLITLALLVGFFTAGGIAIVKQLSDLIVFLQNTLYKLPDFFAQLTNARAAIGPFELDLSYINWDQVGNQLLATIEPALSGIGNIFGGIASGTVSFVGSFLLALIISFLLITETKGNKSKLFHLELPGYQQDLQLLGDKLNQIWNKFVRGQALIYIIRFTLYVIILSALGLRYVFGMALIATIGNFIPYIGVAIAWVINFTIAIFQGTTILGLAPFPYALIVMLTGWILDNIYDTFFAPRLLADVLKLHPAAVLVSVMVGLNLFGLLGMFMAPPVLASIKILMDYSKKKLFDENPWSNASEPLEEIQAPIPNYVKLLKNIEAKRKTKE